MGTRRGRGSLKITLRPRQPSTSRSMVAKPKRVVAMVSRALTAAGLASDDADTAAQTAVDQARAAKKGAHAFGKPLTPVSKEKHPLPADTRAVLAQYEQGQSFVQLGAGARSARSAKAWELASSGVATGADAVPAPHDGDSEKVTCYTTDGDKTEWGLVRPLGAHGRRTIFLLDIDYPPDAPYDKSSPPFSSEHVLVYDGFCTGGGTCFLPLPTGAPEPFGRFVRSRGLHMPRLAMIDPEDGALKFVLHDLDKGGDGEIYGDYDAADESCAANMACADREDRMWYLSMRRTPQASKLGPAPRAVVERWCAAKSRLYGSPNNGVAGVGLTFRHRWPRP